MSAEQQQSAPARLFAVVELFGHARIAGAVSEQTFGGATLVRIDVPEIVVREVDYEGSARVERTRLIPAHTRSFGPGAIYSINWCGEDEARAAAFGIKHEPLQPYSVKRALEQMEQLQPRLAAPARVDPDDHDNEIPY